MEKRPRVGRRNAPGRTGAGGDGGRKAEAQEEDKMSQDARTRDCILFLGAEGCAEMENEPWLRDPTETEVVAFRTGLEARTEFSPGRTDFDQLSIDPMGRPYWIKIVTREAPIDVWLRASSHLRLVRLS
jgi:hypothetical protein